MNYGVRLRFQRIQMIPSCNVAVNVDLSHCCSSLSAYPSVFLYPTKSIFSRHTSLVLSLCITQPQHYGAINKHRQNENRWCCGWVVAEYEWAWVQRTHKKSEKCFLETTVPQPHMVNLIISDFFKKKNSHREGKYKNVIACSMQELVWS